MRTIHYQEDAERLEFAKKAAAKFAANPELATFAIAEIERGCYLAIRWGMGGDGVLVVKVDENDEPTNYARLIPHVKEPMVVPDDHHDAEEN